MAGGIPVYRFGPFDLDPAGNRLYRGQERIPLADTHFAILSSLVFNAGDIVSAETLTRNAWGTTHVDDTTFRQAVRRLRQILGDPPKGGVYIETLRGHGLRFGTRVERAERDAPTASLEGQMAAYRACAQGRLKIDSLNVDSIRQACGDLEDAVRRSPTLAEAHINLARAYALLYEASAADPRRDRTLLTRALEHARTGCDRAPSSADAWSTMTFVLALHGDRAEAEAAGINAAQLESEDVRALLQLAHAMWGAARLRVARRILTLFEGHPYAYWLRATVFIACGALDRAAEELLLGCAAQDAQPAGTGLRAVGLHLLYGHVLAALGRLEEAIAEYRRELASIDLAQLYGPECAANTWFALGALLLRQGQRDEAHRAFERALAIAPCHVPATALLYGRIPPDVSGVEAALGQAHLLVLAGDHAEAARVYLEAIAKAPPGHAGWMLAVEPFLNPLAHPAIWADALALVRARAA